MPFIGYRLLHSIYNWWRGSHLLARDARFQVQHEIFFQIDDWIKNNPPTIRDESSLKKEGENLSISRMEAHVFATQLPLKNHRAFPPNFPTSFTPKFPQATPTLICGICTDAQRLGSISWASSGVTTEPWPNSNILGSAALLKLDNALMATNSSLKPRGRKLLSCKCWEVNSEIFSTFPIWSKGWLEDLVLRKRSLISHWFREKENHQTSSFLKGIW